MSNTAAQVMLQNAEYLAKLKPWIDQFHEIVIPNLWDHLMKQLYPSPHTDDMRQMLDDLGIEDRNPMTDTITFRWSR